MKIVIGAVFFQLLIIVFAKAGTIDRFPNNRDELIPSSRKSESSMMKFVWDVSVADLRKKQNKEWMELPDFRTLNHSVQQLWKLQLYPHGKTLEDQDFISLFLCYGGQDVVETSYELYLLNIKSNKYSRGLITGVFPQETGQCWGYAQFIKRNTVFDRNNGYIIGSYFKIGVRIQSSPVQLPSEQFVWDVSDIDLRNKRNSELIGSSEIRTYSHSVEQLWNLQLYPQGFSSLDQDFFSLYLCNEGQGMVDTQYELYLIRNESIEYSPGFTTNVFSSESGRCKGFARFIDRNTVFNKTNGYINVDKVQIGVRIQSDTVPLPEPDSLVEEFVWGLSVTDLQKKQNKEWVKSSEFKTYNHSVEQIWHLLLYPHGETLETQDFLSFYLCYDAKNTIKTQYELYLSHNNSINYSQGHTIAIFPPSGPCWGYRKFIERNTVFNRNNNYMIGEKIHIGVRLQSDPIPLS